jgi:DNA-binding beta-propeller fold protein YncE
MRRSIRASLWSLTVLCLACNAGMHGQEVTSAATANGPLHDVILVGNSAAGTVSFLDGHSFANLGSLNVVPDLQARLAVINGDLIHAIAYGLITDHQKIKHFEPSNGQRFVDDLFVSPDGTRLYVSRSNLGDVAAFDLVDPAHPILWRTDVAGYHADHATLSPDGTRLVVSATLADKAQVIDAHSGAVVGSFATGHYPHQNDFSADGQRIYNSSIGDVGLPSALDLFKGFRLLTVVDANKLTVVRSYLFSEGIRPSAITADEKTMYAQLSYLNGVIKFDLGSGSTVATLTEPYSAFAQATYPTHDDYPHDSAHHGLALSGDGSRLCDLGTIDNTVQIVTTADMTLERSLDIGLLPYWASTSADGSACLISVSGDNAIAVVDFATGQQLARVPVGKFPQRNRLGQVPEATLDTLSSTSG